MTTPEPFAGDPYHPTQNAASPGRSPNSAHAARPHSFPTIGTVSIDPHRSNTVPSPGTLGQSTPDTVGTDRLDSNPDPTSIAIRNAPPWLVSLLFHMVVLIIAGLFMLPAFIVHSNELLVTYSEKEGEQHLEDTDFLTDDELISDEVIITATDLMEVEDPLASPVHLEVALNANRSTSDLKSPQIGLALSGRQKGMKNALLKAYGGNAGTEAAVKRALDWFVRNQTRDGFWSLKGPYSNSGGIENRTAATAMALLAFQGAGHTHKTGDYQPVVRKGWNALLKDQKDDGDFWRPGVNHHRLYSQAQATIAICELFGMTRDDKYRQPAQRAIDYAVAIQDSKGGWRYIPRSGTDTSVTGWFVMALQSARMAGLQVDSQTLERISKYLDAAASDGGARYGYQAQNAESVPMTAEALLCRQYLGWKRDDPRLISGVQYVLRHPIAFNNVDIDQNVYYWYYATQVVHHMEDDYWDQWNNVMRAELPRQQVTSGKESGSWSPEGDRWGHHGGRLYTTALCTYMLEVYYRHLPIYSDVYQFANP